MANAFVVCTRENKSAIVAALDATGQSFKERCYKNVSVVVFETSARFFEAGGTVAECEIILTSEFGFKTRLHTLTSNVH